MEIDMDFIRRLAELRESTRPESGTAKEGDVRKAVENVIARRPEVSEVVESALEAIGRAYGSERTVGEGFEDLVAEACDVIEGLFFDPGNAAATERLRSLTDEMREVTEKAGPSGEPSVFEGTHADFDEGFLDAVASHVVQMDPTDKRDLAALLDELNVAVDAWQGSNETGAIFQEIRDELETVVAQKKSRKTRRREVVERLSDALEAAMHELEDAELERSPHGVSSREAAAVSDSRRQDVEEVELKVGKDISGDGESEVVEPELTAAQAPAEFPTPDADPQLLLDFVAEGLDYLDQAEQALLALESDPGQRESVDVVFRAFHTIKGVSAFLDLTSIAEIAHESESILDKIRDGSIPFTASAADLFLASADVLRDLLVGVRAATTEEKPWLAPARLAELMQTLGDPSLADRLTRGESAGITRKPQPSIGEEQKAGAANGGGAADSSDESVRIRTDRLDRLVDLVGELVIAHSMISQDTLVRDDRGALQRKVGQSHKILRELQDLSTSLRMVPLKPAFHKVSRVVRDVSRKSGKKVELVTNGGETELDRSMVATITDPLIHIVRNGIDHGIEPPEVREKMGKSPVGRLLLTARQSGGNVVVEIEDDGKGLDREKILKKAISRGLVEEDKVLSDEEVFALILHPGLSTADTVTDISGRGVGMDVVKRAVESLRGRIDITSTPGEGTRFSIALPLTLAITDGMLVRVGSHRYIIPTVKIQVSFRPVEDDLWTVAGKGEMVTLHEDLIPVARLHRIFGVPEAEEDPREAILVIVGESSRRTAVMVDEILDQQQFVVKPLGGEVADTPGISGGAILGDGGVGLILDPEGLIDLARQGGRDVHGGVAA
ncbi:MAG: chemotaxis protein CheA [Gemmatimonadota bacterium]